MSGVMVSVATGVMNSVIDKLTSLLGDEYKVANDVRRGIRFMRDELSSMNAALQRLAEMDDDEIDVQTKEWRSKVRELSYDIEDCVDRFVLLHSSRKAKISFVQSMVRRIKELWEDRRIAREIQDLKALVLEEKERRDRYSIDRYLTITRPVLLDPRAPTMYEDAMDLVGIDGPRAQIIGWLIGGEERQLKVVSIFGIGGQGKTTLAMEVYRKIGGQFHCRASVTVSRALDIKKLFRDLLFQINRSEYDRSERWEMEQLIPTLREQLMDKRYLIIIDDIWTISAWELVKSSLPANNNGSRIITTTRIRDVAKSCCSSIGGHMYEAMPLSEDDSRKLFFRRTFGNSADCPKELQEVATDILRKCGGLPLAISSIAGLLSNKSQTVEVWVKIRKSVSSATEKDYLVDKMKRILFLSYFDLPHYLKSCFLYLSVFPEDYDIDCRQLIRTWVAEGLVPGHDRETMEQQGESCLNELINRSMIQPTRIGADGGTVKYCKVHDVILDFIVSKAVEDNFVAIWNGKDFDGNYSNKIRRLMIQMDNCGAEDMEKAMKNVFRLRSLNVVGSDKGLGGKLFASGLLNNQALRVLNIKGRLMFPRVEDNLNDHVLHIEIFTQLTYLRITHIYSGEKLPEEIGKLQHLETLDVQSTYIRNLPESIVRLQKLVRLFVPSVCALPDGIGNLQALEELSYFSLRRNGASGKCIQGLGDLTQLRALVLFVSGSSAAVKKACILPLSKLLMHLQTLYVEDTSSDSDFVFALMASHGCTLPLRRFILSNSIPQLPSGISSLANLSRFKFYILGEVSKEGLNILASLPILLSLTVVLMCDGDVFHPRHVIGGQGFCHLVKFTFGSFQQDAALEFEPEAMPKLQRLKLKLKAWSHFKYGQGGLLLGLQNLSALRYMNVRVACDGTTVGEVEAMEDAIRGAADAHPNRPKLKVRRVGTPSV